MDITLVYKHGRSFVIGKEIPVTLSDGRKIIIPKGFETDLSSIPAWGWSVFKPFDDGLLGDLVHDYLWVCQLSEIEHFGGSFKARKFADDERTYWRKKLAPNLKIKNYLTHKILRIFGGLFYSRQLNIPN